MTGGTYGQIDCDAPLDGFAARLAGEGWHASAGRHAVRLSGAGIRCKFEPAVDGFLLAGGLDADDPLAGARSLSRWLASRGLRHRLEIYDDEGTLAHYVHHDWPQPPDRGPDDRADSAGHASRRDGAVFRMSEPITTNGIVLRSTVAVAQGDAALQAMGERIAGALGPAVTRWVIAHGELTLGVQASDIVYALTYLRDEPSLAFRCFVDICGADYPERARRFDVVYHLLSMRHNARIRVKVETDETTPVPSAIPVFPSANWFERETYDLYGIYFSGHPDLRRLLTDYGFEGHPLRKDFPLTGFVEVRYDQDEARVVYEPVKLTQEFRNFDFLSPWEGTDYVLPGDEKTSS